MLQAMNTGHEGSLSTVHANSPRDALNRLETMVLMAGYELPLRAIRSHVSSALDLVVQLDRLDDGSRRVVEISEVQRMEGEVITLQKLFEFKIDHFDAERRIVGKLHPTGLRPGFLGKFERHGIELPLSLFGGAASAIYGANAQALAGPGQRGRRQMRPARALLAGARRHARPVRRGPRGLRRAVQIAPVTRLPFPERGYVVSVSEAAELRRRERRRSRERPPRHRRARRPAGEQRASLRRRARARRQREHDRGAGGGRTRVGARVRVASDRRRGGRHRRVQRRHLGAARAHPRRTVTLRRALATQPPLAYGTRIYDALVRSLALLREAKLSSGSIVLLSDGADIGSLHSLDEAVAAAKKQQMRIFTVGLRSGAFDAEPLRAIAERTGGSYAEARSAAELASIYEALGEQLAGEYLVRYRSAARPMSQVEVGIEVAGAGSATTAYVAPTPSLLAPYHRSLAVQVPPLGQLAAPDQPALRAARLLAAARARSAAEDDGRRPRPDLRERAAGRRAPSSAATAALRAATRNRYATGWWAQLERDLELARMTVTPRQVVGMALAGTFLHRASVAFMLSAPLFALFGLTTPLVARAWSFGGS